MGLFSRSNNSSDRDAFVASVVRGWSRNGKMDTAVGYLCNGRRYDRVSMDDVISMMDRQQASRPDLKPILEALRRATTGTQTEFLLDGGGGSSSGSSGSQQTVKDLLEQYSQKNAR